MAIKRNFGTPASLAAVRARASNVFANVLVIVSATVLALAAMVALSFSNFVLAFTPVNAPVTLKVTPTTALIKSTVTISGSSLALGKNNQISIAIAPASGKPQILSATLDSGGAFTASFVTTGEGKFSVTATAPDGKGTAVATLTVVSPAGAAASTAQQSTALIKTMQNAQDIGDNQITALPASPVKEDFQKKSADLKTKLAAIPAAQKQYESALNKFYELGHKYPETLPALKPLFDDIDNANQAIQKQNEDLEKRLTQAAKKNAKCDSLEAATEAFTALSTSMNLIAKPWGILRNFAIDKGPGKLVEAMPNNKASDAQKFIVAETFKVSASILVGGAAGGPIAAGAAVIGVVGDIAQFFTQQKFAQYCEKFEGPVYAQFRSEMREKGKPYFTYKLNIRGKMQLRFNKDATIKAGQPIALTGQIEGIVEDFEMSENAIIIAPKLKSRVLMHKIFAPPCSPYLEDVGSIARMALPHSFYIPVKGELLNDKITLKLEEATKDFSSLIKAQIFYVFLEPSLPIPLVQTVDAPIQNAFFIFDRGMRAKPEFEVKTVGGKPTIDKTFARTVDDPASDFKIEWKIEAKACNPSCLPSVYFSKAK